MSSSNPVFKRETSSGNKLKVISKKESSGSPRGSAWIMLLFIGVVLLAGYHIYDKGKEVAPGIIETPDGDIALSPERKAKLARELEEIDNAVQYALVAKQSGIFPCYTCPNGQITIFLNELETWKYGVTRKGEKERYPDGNYGAPNLLFVVEHEGNYAECLKMEKIKIYNYPFLPQSRTRSLILHRPPGNKYDS